MRKAIIIIICALAYATVWALALEAQSVIDRWDSPLWKDLPHTGESIGELRDALAALKETE